MDFQKIKVYLDKLNREFARMSKDPENVARIDRDILTSYIRELYDAALSEENSSERMEQPRKAPAPKMVEPVAPPVPPPAPPAPPPPPPVVAPAPVVVVEAPAPPPPAPEVKPAPAPPPPEPAPEPVKPARVAQPHAGEFEVLFEEKQAKELSEKLSDLPVADLKKAIALNDRLLLTRELFAGDGQAFESAIQQLNALNDFADAKSYLIENCVVRFGWMDKKRIEEAKNFIKLVRRRYK